jgi:aspartate carbamoyltransferase catalytic subunit
MNILTSDQFSQNQIKQIFTLADDMLLNPAKYEKTLNKKIIATVFYEPSTRTRLSFESAVQRLGGQIISTENAKEVSSAVKGESLSDTMRIISGYCDGIVIRHFDVDSAQIAALSSTVPVINAGSGAGEHPTQALLDAYTIYKKHNALNGLKIAFMGDLKHGRTVHSLVKLLAKYENNVIYGVSHSELGLPENYVTTILKNNTYVALRTLNDLPKDIHVIYQTRNQVERFDDQQTAFPEFVINNQLLNLFQENAILMHPLPRNAEISIDCDQNPRSAYFEQARNGIPIRMALLACVFSGNPNMKLII